MITLNNAEVKLYNEKGLEGKICWIGYNMDDQDFDTLKTVGRSISLSGNMCIQHRIIYQGILLFPR